MAGERGAVVLARINYLGAFSGKPAFHAKDHAKDTFALDPREVEIANARARAAPPRLDEEGFELASWPTSVADFEDPASASAHRAEIEALIKALTGASLVLASGMGVVRHSERSGRRDLPAANRPARFAHADYTDESSPWWVRRMLPPDEAERLLAGRFAVYNIWRVLTPPPQDAPLAVCDARSVRPDDQVVADAVADFDHMPDKPRFDAALFRHSPRHRWSYFPEMTPDEVLVFKQFDSDPSRANRTPHCAFDDPSCPKDALPRRNVDTRAFAFFEEGAP